MSGRRLATLLLLLLPVGSLVPAGDLDAELVPIGPEVLLGFSSLFSGTPRVAAHSAGAYVTALDDNCEPPGTINVDRSIAAGGSSTPMLRRRGQSIWSWRYDAVTLDSLTATPAGFDILWSPCGVPCAETRKVFHRSHLDASGKLVAPAVRLGSAHWVWHLGDDELLAGAVRSELHAIEARRLTAAGAPAGPVLQLNSRPVDKPLTKVVPAADGGFLAVWLAAAVPSEGNWVLRARRFSPAGEPLGPDFDVNSLAGNIRSIYCDTAFEIASAPGGGFAVSWVLDQKLYLRLFDAAAAPLGPDVLVDDSNAVWNPSSMAFDPAGNLLLLWELQSYAFDLRLQLFDGSGRPLGTPIRPGSEPFGIVQPISGDVTWAGDSWLVAWDAALYPFDQGTAYLRRFAYQSPVAGDAPASE